MTDEVAGPERAILDAFDLVRTAANGSDHLFEAARRMAADYDAPGDLAAGVASVARLLLEVLASVTNQPADALLDQAFGTLGDSLLKHSEGDA